MQDALASFRAVLFDFDGTLADSYPAIAASVNHVRGWHGLPPLPVAEVKRHVGRGPNYLIEHTVPGSDAADVDRYRAHHPSVMIEGTALLPGAREAIDSLHRAGKAIGLCSNKPVKFSTELLRHFGFGEKFGVILGPELVPAPKPAPDMLQLALRRLELRAEEVLYVGDMTVDIDTARAAGVTVWIVPTGSDTLATLEKARPDRMLRDLYDLAGK